MTIALERDVEDFLKEQMRTGACADASELVNDVLRLIRDQQHKPFEVTSELEAWLLKAAGQPDTVLTPTDFHSIRKRVRSRTRSGGS